jgi:hypothetical protein
MEYHIQGRSKYSNYVESLLPSMFSQLKLTKSKKFLQVIIDNSIEEDGVTIPLTGVNTYLIVLRPQKDLINVGVTLAHELTHVAQFAKGILKLTPKGKRWKGKFYGRGVAYLQQPWEIQAFQKQELLFRRAID